MGKVSARQRVRAARAKLDAERVAREKRVDEAAERYYQQAEQIAKADEQLEKARQAHEAALQGARREQRAAIVAMLEEGESASTVSVLLHVSRSEITAARKDQRPVDVAEQPAGDVHEPVDEGAA